MPTAVHRWFARPLTCTNDWVRVRHAGPSGRSEKVQWGVGHGLHTWLPWELRLVEIQEAAFSRPSSNSTLPLAHCRITAHTLTHTQLWHCGLSSRSYPLKHTFTYFREILHSCKDLMPQHNTLALVQRANPIELNTAGRVQPNDTSSVQPYSSQHFPQFNQLAQYCSCFLPCSEHYRQGLFTWLPKNCREHHEWTILDNNMTDLPEAKI